MHAGHFHGKLSGTVPSPDEMGMGIHKTGHHHATAGVQGRLTGQGGAQVTGLANGSDLLIVYKDGSVLDDAKPTKVAAALWTVFQSQELGGGMDEHVTSPLSQPGRGLPA